MTRSTSPPDGRDCSVGTTDSLGRAGAAIDPQRAYVVKGLNIVQADVMINPTLTGGEPDMFIAGDSDEAKQTVTNLLEEFGWPVIDSGWHRERPLVGSPEPGMGRLFAPHREDTSRLQAHRQVMRPPAGWMARPAECASTT